MEKKYFSLLVGIILIISAFYYYFQVDNSMPGEPGLTYTKVVVAGDINLPPYEFVDEDGEFVGFNVDVMRAIALEMGFDLTFVPMKWEETQQALLSGEVDAIQGMRKNEERDKIFDFTSPYFQNNYAIFSSSQSEISSIKDLDGKTLTAIQGDASNQILLNLKGITIKIAPDVKSAIEMVSRGEADAAIGNPIVGIYFINHLNLNDQINISSTDLSSAAYGMAVKEGNTLLQNQLDLGLEKIKKNGTFDKIYFKWFGRPLNYQQEALANTLRFLRFGLIGAALSALALFVWNSNLKKQVQKRTLELYEESQFNSAILQSIANGILYLKSDKETRFMNAEGNRIFALMSDHGYSEHEIEDLILNSEEDVFNEMEFRGTKGVIHLEWRHKIVKMPDKEDMGHIIVFSDKTEKKYFEEAFLSQDRLRSVGLLMAEIAHEIRNPLTTIRNYAQLIPEKVHNKDFLESFSVDVPSEIDRLNDIIKDVLDYTKPGVSYNESVSPVEVVKETLKMVNMRFERRGFEVTLDSPGTGPTLLANISRKHLKQILLNVYLNALEAMEGESGQVNTQIKANQNLGIEIVITDTGKGMADEEIQRLFEPFYSRKKDGTGLGIFICDRLLKLYGGKIHFESVPGSGTVCTISLQGGPQNA
jgi:polar amino acid transport system substrate-binding protein